MEATSPSPLTDILKYLRYSGIGTYFQWIQCENNGFIIPVAVT